MAGNGEEQEMRGRSPGPEASRGGEMADVMNGSLAGGTGTGGSGSMDGHSVGAGLEGQTRTGDTGTGTPMPPSAEGTGTTGAIPETQHEGSSAGAGNMGVGL